MAIYDTCKIDVANTIKSDGCVVSQVLWGSPAIEGAWLSRIAEMTSWKEEEREQRVKELAQLLCNIQDSLFVADWDGKEPFETVYERNQECVDAAKNIYFYRNVARCDEYPKWVEEVTGLGYDELVGAFLHSFQGLIVVLSG